MNFGSDNTAPVAPQIMEALARANNGRAPAYGADEWSHRLQVSPSLPERQPMRWPCRP